MGRILRTGVDTTINYSFEETSNYDEDNPAGTTSAWGDSVAMDQLFDQPEPTAVIDAQGCLITFQRFPDFYEGVMVKVVGNYDLDAGESPALEHWTHNAETDVWTKRNRKLFASVFEGSPDGERKIYDFTFGIFEQNVDKVWVTMDPGDTGTPTLDWYSIQLFGECEDERRTAGGGGGDPCDDPNGPFYPGDDICKDKTYGSDPNTCKDLPDYCNEASIQAYRECLRANFPSFLPIFDAQLDANRDALRDACSGNGPFPPEPPLPPQPNPLPPLDLCDPDSIEAFRAAVSGDATHLAQFNAYIDTLEESGYFELVCPDPDPDEVPLDPETMQPDPDIDDEPTTPFGHGPGGNPPPPTVPDTESTPTGGDVILEKTARFIMVWCGDDSAVAEPLVTSLIGDLPPSTDSEIRETNSGFYGPETGPTFPLAYTPAAYRIDVRMNKMPVSARVGVRCKRFRLTGAPELTSSIGAGLINTTVAPPCPPGPDWILTPGTGLELADDVVLGDDYYEYTFTGANFRNNTVLQMAVPREDPSQNDGAACTGTEEPRSIFAFQRGGCLSGFTVKLRARWLPDVSLEDYNATTPFDYLHVRPYCLVVDVQVKPSFISGEDPRFDVDPTTIEVAFVKDAQPTETCP